MVSLAAVPAGDTAGTVWSPDGSQLAYVALRGGSFEICRKPSNGQGEEDVLYKLPGIAIPTDWSSDGRFLTISSADLEGEAYGRSWLALLCAQIICPVGAKNVHLRFVVTQEGHDNIGSYHQDELYAPLMGRVIDLYDMVSALGKSDPVGLD